MFPQDKELRLVQEGVWLSANVLAKDPTQFASQLTGRLLSIKGHGVKSLLQQIAKAQADPWVRLLSPTLMPSGGHLLRTLEGHTSIVNRVTVAADGKVVSASSDETLKIWDINTGKLLRTLEGHTDKVKDIYPF